MFRACTRVFSMKYSWHQWYVVAPNRGWKERLDSWFPECSSWIRLTFRDDVALLGKLRSVRRVSRLAFRQATWRLKGHLASGG
jgi:hypothetical protein